MDFEHVLDELYSRLNEIRLHPRETAAYLTQLKSSYNGKLFKNKVKTREGSNALMDLIGDFAQRKPILNRLKWSFALHMAADDQAQILGQKGLFTTEGTKYNRTLPQRVRDYAIVRGRISQVYQFGGRTPQQILQELLIDDGLASRKRRNTLMDPIYKYIGIGSSYHQTNQACTVIILAQDIISLVAPDAAGKYKKRRGIQTGKQNVIKLTDQIMINNQLGKLVYNAVDSTHNPNPNQNININAPNVNNNMIGNNVIPNLVHDTNSSGVYSNPNNTNPNNTSLNSSYQQQPPINPSYNKQPEFILTQNPQVFDSRNSNQTAINNLNTTRPAQSYVNDPTYNTGPMQLQGGNMMDSRGSLAPSHYTNTNVNQPAYLQDSRGSVAPSQQNVQPAYMQDSRGSLAPSNVQGGGPYMQDSRGSLAPSQQQNVQPAYMQDSRGSLAPSQQQNVQPAYMQDSRGSLAPSQSPSRQTNYPPPIPPVPTQANYDPTRQSQYNSNPSFGQNSVIQPHPGQNVLYATPGDSRISNQSLVPPLANQSQNISSSSYSPNPLNSGVNTNLNPNTNTNMNTSSYSNTNQSPTRNTNYPPAPSSNLQQPYLNQSRQGSVVTYQPTNTNNIHPQQFNSTISNPNIYNSNVNNTNFNNSYVVPKTVNNSSVAQSQLKRQQQQQYNFYKLPDNNIGGLATTQYNGPQAVPATTDKKKDSKCAIM